MIGDERWLIQDSGFREMKDERRGIQDGMGRDEGFGDTERFFIFDSGCLIWLGWWMTGNERFLMVDEKFERVDEKRRMGWGETREIHDGKWEIWDNVWFETMGCGESFDDGIRREFWWWDAERVETMFDDGIQMFDERLSMMGCGEMRKLRR